MRPLTSVCPPLCELPSVAANAVRWQVSSNLSEEMIKGLLMRMNKFNTERREGVMIRVKRGIVTWASSAAGLCGFPSPPGSSSKCRLLSDFPRGPFEDDDCSPPEPHKQPAHSTTVEASPNMTPGLRGHIFVTWPHPDFLQIVKRLVGQTQEALDGFAVEQTHWKLQVADTVCGELLNATTRTCWWRLCRMSSSAGTSAARYASPLEALHRSCFWTSA